MRAANSWTTQNTSTAATTPKNLTVPVSQSQGAFTFNPDTTVVTFTVLLGNATPGSVGKQYNLTVYNDNGTSIETQVWQVHVWNSGCTWNTTDQIGSDATFPNTPSYQTWIITALSPVQIYIQVTSQSFIQGAGASWGGYITITETGGYQQVPLAQGAAFSPVNVTDFQASQRGFYAQEFSVSTTGWYYLQVNATSTYPAHDPSFNILIFEKGLGVSAYTGDTPVIGLGTMVLNLMVGHNSSKGFFVNTQLQANSTYVLILTSDHFSEGYLSYCDVKPLNTYTGVIGAAGSQIDFTNAFQDSNTQYSAYIQLPQLKFDTLYSWSISAPTFPWDVTTVNGLFSMYYPQMGVPSSGCFIVSQNQSPNCTEDGQPFPKFNLEYFMCKEWIFGNASIYYPIPQWTQTYLSDPLWQVPYIHIAIANSLGDPSIGLLGPITLIIKENGSSIPDFNGTVSATDPSYSSRTFTFQNDGSSGDSMGIYKISGKKGSELQLQVLNLQGATEVNNNETNQFSLSFATSLYSGISSQNIMSTGGQDFGYAVPWGEDFTIDNGTYHPYLWPDGAAKIYETALFTDPVYILIESSVMIGSGLPGDITNNASQITLNWTYEPFKKSGDTYVVSQDNQIQVYDVNIPICGIYTYASVYGNDPVANDKGFITLAEMKFYPDPLNFCWETNPFLVTAFPYLGASSSGLGLSWGVAFHAYIVIDWNILKNYGVFPVTIPYGSVMRFTVTSCTPVDWLAWGIAIGALVALAVGITISLVRRHHRTA